MRRRTTIPSGQHATLSSLWLRCAGKYSLSHLPRCSCRMSAFGRLRSIHENGGNLQSRDEVLSVFVHFASHSPIQAKRWVSSAWPSTHVQTSPSAVWSVRRCWLRRVTKAATRNGANLSRWKLCSRRRVAGNLVNLCPQFSAARLTLARIGIDLLPVRDESFEFLLMPLFVEALIFCLRDAIAFIGCRSLASGRDVPPEKIRCVRPESENVPEDRSDPGGRGIVKNCHGSTRAQRQRAKKSARERASS